jgi:hypothetical protein
MVRELYPSAAERIPQEELLPDLERALGSETERG